MQHLMQVVSGGISVELRPEQVGDLVAMQPMRRFKCQQLDQCLRLAQPPRAVSDHPIALGYLETAQEPDSHGWPPLSSARRLLIM